jgi:heme/copper-type cytochrome/quinol oxidase subunit 2
MNTIKRILGVVWIVLAPVLVIFMFNQASEKVAAATEGIARTNTLLQWAIILIIFIPICVGLVIFGLYAVKGEYDHLPESSDEL